MVSNTGPEVSLNANKFKIRIATVKNLHFPNSGLIIISQIFIEQPAEKYTH